MRGCPAEIIGDDLVQFTLELVEQFDAVLCAGGHRETSVGGKRPSSAWQHQPAANANFPRIAAVVKVHTFCGYCEAR
jgi:hypothetical protein